MSGRRPSTAESSLGPQERDDHCAALAGVAMGILSELDVISSLPFLCIAIALVNQALHGFWCCAQAQEEQVPQAAASGRDGRQSANHVLPVQLPLHDRQVAVIKAGIHLPMESMLDHQGLDCQNLDHLMGAIELDRHLKVAGRIAPCGRCPHGA